MMSLMLSSKERKAILDLQEVLDWVKPMVEGKLDEWKAKRLQTVIDLTKDEDEITLDNDREREQDWYDLNNS